MMHSPYRAAAEVEKRPCEDCTLDQRDHLPLSDGRMLAGPCMHCGTWTHTLCDRWHQERAWVCIACRRPGWTWLRGKWWDRHHAVCHDDGRS